LWANFFDNPILFRELRRRMQGKALIISIISYVALMTVATVMIVLISSPSVASEASNETLLGMRQTGELIFSWVTGIQGLLVLLVAPTITAGLTTGEKERQTFDFLRATTITRWMYVLGCFLSTVFYVALALICALPLLSLSLLYGGVTAVEIIQAQAVLLVGSSTLSAFGLYVSSVVHKTRHSQGIIVFMIFALLFGGSILVQLFRRLYSGAVTGGQAGFYLGEIPISEWTLLFSALGGVTFLFLLLAARKLFEPEECRALSHWQFGLLFGIYSVLSLVIFQSNTFTTEAMETVVLLVGSGLLLFCAFSFSIGRMQVGDEVWHVKRLLPFLRPIDQTLPFLVAVGAAWFGLLQMLSTLPVVMGPDQLRAFAWSSTATYALLCAVGRGTLGFTGSAKRSTIAVLAGALVLLLGIPLLTWALGYFASSELLPLLGSLSATWVLEQSLATRSQVLPELAIGLGLVALVVLIAGEAARYRRFRDFDYHYDMPQHGDFSNSGARRP
jgi:hypothetical protein